MDEKVYLTSHEIAASVNIIEAIGGFVPRELEGKIAAIRGIVASLGHAVLYEESFDTGRRIFGETSREQLIPLCLFSSEHHDLIAMIYACIQGGFIANVGQRLLEPRLVEFANTRYPMHLQKPRDAIVARGYEILERFDFLNVIHIPLDAEDSITLNDLSRMDLPLCEEDRRRLDGVFRITPATEPDQRAFMAFLAFLATEENDVDENTVLHGNVVGKSDAILTKIERDAQISFGQLIRVMKAYADHYIDVCLDNYQNGSGEWELLDEYSYLPVIAGARMISGDKVSVLPQVFEKMLRAGLIPELTENEIVTLVNAYSRVFNERFPQSVISLCEFDQSASDQYAEKLAQNAPVIDADADNFSLLKSNVSLLSDAVDSTPHTFEVQDTLITSITISSYEEEQINIHIRGVGEGDICFIQLDNRGNVWGLSPEYMRLLPYIASLLIPALRESDILPHSEERRNGKAGLPADLAPLKPSAIRIKYRGPSQGNSSRGISESKSGVSNPQEARGGGRHQRPNVVQISFASIEPYIAHLSRNQALQSRIRDKFAWLAANGQKGERYGAALAGLWKVRVGSFRAIVRYRKLPDGSLFGEIVDNVEARDTVYNKAIRGL